LSMILLGFICLEFIMALDSTHGISGITLMLCSWSVLIFSLLHVE
jgi:hypothetical protein